MKDIVDVYEIGYNLEDVKVRFLKNINLNIFDIIINAKPDDTTLLPRWVANILKKNKYVEINEQDISIELSRALSREKITGSEQLSPLKADFYIRLRDVLKNVNEVERDKLLIYLHDLLDIRIWKIINLSRSVNLTSDLEQKLTIEERILFNLIYKAINELKDMVLKV